MAAIRETRIGPEFNLDRRHWNQRVQLKPFENKKDFDHFLYMSIEKIVRRLPEIKLAARESRSITLLY
jgi:hypothetical protein